MKSFITRIAHVGLIGTLVVSSLTAQDTGVHYDISVQMMDGNYTQAINMIDEQLQQLPEDPELYFLKGTAHFNVMQYHIADSAFARAIELDSTSIKYMSFRANCNYEMDRFSVAHELLDHILQEDSTRIQSRILLAKVFQRQMDFNQAIKQYELLARQDSLNPAYPKQMGLLSLRMDSLNHALSYLEKAQSLDTLDVQIYVRLGQLYLRVEQGNKTDFIESRKEMLERGIAIDSTQGLLYRYLGALNMLQGHYKTSAEHFRNAISYGDSTEYSFRHYGVSLFQEAEYAKALPVFNKTIELDPEDEQAWYYLGFCYKWNENVDEAIKCLDRALELAFSPAIASIYNGLGQFHSLKRDFQQAIDHFVESYKYDTTQVDVLAQIGILIEESGGDKKVAKDYYERYLESKAVKDPNLVTYITNRVQIINEKLFMEAPAEEKK